MAYLPKDYARVESKIVFGLSFKKLLTLCFFAVIALMILKSSFINWLLKILLIIPIVIITPIFMFYKTVEGDDLVTYLFNLLIYYTSPKYLIYKKQSPQERGNNNGKKE